MKMIFLVLTLTVSSVSQQTVDASFGWNEKLERVWVEMTVYESYRNDESYSGDFYLVKVHGPSFDPQTQTANLDIEGQIIECVAVKQRGVLVIRPNYLKTTNYSFKSKLVTTFHDNGFEIEERHRLHVYLVTK